MQNTERSVSGCNKGATEIIPSEIQTEKGWGKMSRLMTVEDSGKKCSEEKISEEWLKICQIWQNI